MKQRSKPRVLFTSAFNTPFIQDDIDVLTQHFETRVKIGHGIFHMLKLPFHLFWADVAVCWFASVYAAVVVRLGKLLGVRSLIIVGGADVSKEEGLGYGIWLTPWKGWLVGYALRNADRVWVVTSSFKDDAIHLAEYDGKNIQYVPTGYEGAVWRPLGKKEKFVLIVASTHDRINVLRKGLDTLIEASRLVPDVSFLVVGTEEGLVEEFHPPSNIIFHGRIPREELLQFYQRAKVYCQPSRREGLPNALCEAMLCECVPIGSDVNGIPMAIGNTGFLVPPQDPPALSASIRQAMNAPESLGAEARARIMHLFPKENRVRRLVDTMNELATQDVSSEVSSS
jgi:glycosyltransferase involved in cell wall biosynthesis